MITRGKNLKNEEIAYIAGLFDGEGNVNIFMVFTPTMQDQKKNPKYELSIAIYNTHKPVIDWLYEIFGGYVQTKNATKNSSYKKHWKENYSWKLGATQAKDFLEMVLPYLQIKKEQAAIAINFQTLHSDKTNKFWRNPPERVAEYHAYYLQLRRLIDSPRWQLNKSVAAERFTRRD